jgi:hypothetical protein
MKTREAQRIFSSRGFWFHFYKQKVWIVFSNDGNGKYSHPCTNHYLNDKLLEDGLSNYPLDWLQLWDAFSPYVTCIKYEYLKNSACKIVLKDKQWHNARYLMTFDWIHGPEFQTGQSENPGGHKQGHLLVGEGGQYFIQPGNRVVWRDGGAWIGSELKGHEKWIVFSKEFSCEQTGSRWFAGEEELYFYQFEENKDK